MRTIKFRVQAIDNSNIKYWLYFDLSKSEENPIAKGEAFGHKVLKETVGQFTGLFDKNGKEIYEGDVLNSPASSKWDETNYMAFEVFFHDGDANSDYNIGYSMNRTHKFGAVCGGYIPSFKPEKVSKMIIIGNIHDNPELLN